MTQQGYKILKRYTLEDISNIVRDFPSLLTSTEIKIIDRLTLSLNENNTYQSLGEVFGMSEKKIQSIERKAVDTLISVLSRRERI